MWHIIILIQHCELTSARVNYSVSSAYFKVRWCRLRTSSGVHFNNYFQEGAGLCAESKPGWNWWGRLSADPIHNPPSVHNLLWLLRLWQEIPTQATQGSNCACQDSVVPVLVSRHTCRCWLCWPARGLHVTCCRACGWWSLLSWAGTLKSCYILCKSDKQFHHEFLTSSTKTYTAFLLSMAEQNIARDIYTSEAFMFPRKRIHTFIIPYKRIHHYP